MTSSSPVAAAPPQAAAPPKAYNLRWVVLAIVLVAEIMDLLDSTVITIAAPTVRHELGGSTATMQWWAAGYTLAFGVFMIIGGRLGDLFGRKWAFIGGLLGFALASAIGGAAQSFGVLVGARSAAEIRDAAEMAHLDIPAGLWAALQSRGLLPRDAPVPTDRAGVGRVR